MARINMGISDDLHQWIKEEADSRELTMNAVVIFALETYRQQISLTPTLTVLKELADKLENN